MRSAPSRTPPTRTLPLAQPLRPAASASALSRPTGRHACGSPTLTSAPHRRAVTLVVARPLAPWVRCLSGAAPSRARASSARTRATMQSASRLMSVASRRRRQRAVRRERRGSSRTGTAARTVTLCSRARMPTTTAGMTRRIRAWFARGGGPASSATSSIALPSTANTSGARSAPRAPSRRSRRGHAARSARQ